MVESECFRLSEELENMWSMDKLHNKSIHWLNDISMDYWSHARDMYKDMRNEQIPKIAHARSQFASWCRHSFLTNFIVDEENEWFLLPRNDLSVAFSFTSLRILCDITIDHMRVEYYSPARLCAITDNSTKQRHEARHSFINDVRNKSVR